MTNFLASLTLISSLIVGIYAPFAQTPPTQSELEDAARVFIGQLSTGDYQAAAAAFDQEMLKAVPQDRLESIWMDVIQRYGEMQTIADVEIAESGEYTAVNVKTNFERAVVNLRVVFNRQGQISGFFQYPIELVGKPSAGLLAGLGFNAIFLLLGPLALGWLARRRLGVPWRVFWIGAGIFILFQVFLRMPLVNLIQASLGARLASSTAVSLAWIAALSLSAGLVEEVGRYIGYRWLLPGDPKTWKVGVMYGLGHGGIEAILLAGFSALTSLVVVLAWPQLSAMLPPVQAAPLAMQIAPMMDAGAWLLPPASAWERICAITLHVALSLTVLQAFRRGNTGWLWAAVGAHTLANLVVIGLPVALGTTGQSTLLLSSILLAGVGLAAAFAIYRLRE